jgi:hypothetical protein
MTQYATFLQPEAVGGRVSLEVKPALFSLFASLLSLRPSTNSPTFAPTR